MEMVRVFDTKTKKVYTIPAAELAPGMVRANVPGIEGPVWIDMAQLNLPKKPRHPPFSEEVRDRLRLIQSILDEVKPMTLEKWESGFRMDAHPEKEIALWMSIAGAYARVTSDVTWTLDQKKEILNVLLVCSTGGAEQVLQTIKLEALSREQAAEIARQYSRDR
jgi:hypothetical protein